jgi:hypothetical protein
MLSTSMSTIDLTAVETDLQTIKSELETIKICLKTHLAQEPTLDHRALPAISREDTSEYGFQAKTKS